MVAVQNYLGNPAPPGKPVLTFQTGDVIELLRGDPESQWWEVGPGRISPPSAPLHSPGQKWKCRISRQGWVCGARPSEGRWLFAGPGCRGVCFDMAGGAASPRQRDRRPSPLPAASCLGCVLYTSPTLLPSLPQSRPAPRAQRWGDSMSEALHSRPPGDTGPRDGLWFRAENPAVPVRGPEKGGGMASAAPLLSPTPGGPHGALGTRGTHPARGPQ